ncbi:MAG: S53 family peptidase, partial [Ktedonobacterales bacterium]
MQFWRNLPLFARRRPYGPLGVAATILTVLALVAIFLSGTAGIFASPNSPSTRAIDTHHSHQVRLHGVKPRALDDLKATGKEDGARLLQLSIALRLAQPIALNGLIAQQQARSSAQYHQYVTPQSFTDRYAPSADNVAAVRNFLQQSGMKVTGISSNRLLVNAEGTVAQVEKAFGVSIVRYQLGKRLVFAPEQDPIIPDTLAATVLSIGGLDDVAAMHPNFNAKGSNAQATAASGTKTTGGASPLVINPSPAGGFTPTNLRTAYDVSTLITKGGTGVSQRVAVFELAPYIPSDITTYRTQYGLPNSPINNISVDGAKVTCTSGANCDQLGVLESDLDIEVLSALAPNATLDVYVGPSTAPYTPYINDTYNAIVTRNVDTVVTTSWGVCESNSGTAELQVLDNIFAQAAAQGQTIFAAAGDAGSDDCRSNPQTPPSVDSPASDPYVMGVGGTALTLSATGGYGSESVWNSHDGVSAGGGGLSGNFSKPTWQVGSGVTNSYASGQREVPDVAAEAEINTGYSVYCTSITPQCSWQDVPYGWMTVGGTGGAAPLWAAVTADINSYLSGHGFAPFGWANPTFYTLFTGAQIDPAF